MDDTSTQENQITSNSEQPPFAVIQHHEPVSTSCTTPTCSSTLNVDLMDNNQPPPLQPPPEYRDTCIPPPYASIVKEIQDERRHRGVIHLTSSITQYANAIRCLSLFVASYDVAATSVITLVAIVSAFTNPGPSDTLAILLPFVYLLSAILGRIAIHTRNSGSVNAYLIIFCSRYLVDLMTVIFAIYQNKTSMWNIDPVLISISFAPVGIRPLYEGLFPCGSYWRPRTFTSTDRCFQICSQLSSSISSSAATIATTTTTKTTSSSYNASDGGNMSAGFKVVVFMLTPHFIFLCLLISHSTVLSLYHRRRKLRNSDLIPTYSQTIERENLTVDLGVNSPITVVTTPSRAYLSNAEVTGFQDAGSQEMTEDIEGRPGVE